MTVRPEPNVDALAETAERGVTRRIVMGEDRPRRSEQERVDNARAAIRELAARARANTTRDQLLHDAMDALAYVDDWRDRVGIESPEALLARFRALTGEKNE